MNTAKCVTCHLPGAGSSSSPCSDTYAGSAAFSEVENRNIRDFITTIASKTNVAITIHSYSQLWLIPWGSYSYKPSDYNELVCAFHFEKKAIVSEKACTEIRLRHRWREYAGTPVEFQLNLQSRGIIQNKSIQKINVENHQKANKCLILLAFKLLI
jgi:hypothetical protein